jgi:hypothetical protein
MIEFFHCFNCFKKNTTLRKEVSFTTAFLKINTLYTINNLVRLDRHSNACRELLSIIDYIDHTGSTNTLYETMLSKIEFNSIGQTNSNIIFRQCVLHAKRLNVPLVHFSEFDDSIQDIESIQYIDSVIERMEYYANDKLNLLSAIDCMNTVNDEIKNNISHDICDNSSFD